MKEISFLTKDHVLHLHKKAINDYGGTREIRDLSLLESALAQPAATFDGEYLHKNIYVMASAYFYHISQNQPFMDGNKRTGLLVLYMFLKINGFILMASNDILYPILLEVADGKLDKYDLAIFIEEHTIKN